MSAEKFATLKTAPEGDLAALAAETWQILASEPGFHPARDAAAMRAFVRRGAGAAPPGTLARTWRMIAGDAWAAGVGQAGGKNLKRVVTAGGDPVATETLARGYFGYSVPFTQASDVREALDRVAATPGEVACLPWPEQSGPGQWWPMLNEQKLRGLSVLACWPSILDAPDPAAPGADRCVAIVGALPVESSGEDDMLATCHDDRHEAVGLLAHLGLKAEVTARVRSLALLRIRDFLAPDDGRIEQAIRLGLDGLRIVGVRPRP